MSSNSEITGQTKSRVYREDTLYQLKLELDTSLEGAGRMTFTKDLLNLRDYKGKPLDTYPFFAPYKIYRKGKIQRMAYLDRIELFFNRQRFEQVIFGRKSRTRRKKAKRQQYIRNDELETLKTKNFIFTMKMLFSTAFPIVDNFSRSSEYFTNDITSNFSFKGTNLEFLPFLSGKFDKKFSHLNINNNIYTITKVIWVNDVFNHPLYNRIVDNYRKIQDDLRALETREDAILKRKDYLVKTVLEIPIDNESGFSSQPEGNWDDIENKLNIYVENLEGKSEGRIGRLSDTQLRVKQIKQDIDDLIRDSRSNKNTYPIDSGETLSSAKVDFINKFMNTIGKAIPSIRDFLKQGIISDKSEQFLRDIYNTFETIRIDSLAIRYIKSFEFRFSKEKEEDQVKIKKKIEEIFPRASEFSKQLESFAFDRTIGNEIWSKLVQSRQLSKVVKKNFDELAQCYTNENCNLSEEGQKYVEVELDEITKRPENAKVEMYEAYLQLNIVEGEVTRDNYSKIKCTYLDEELDNFLDNFINPQDDWNIQNEKNYFSVKDVVEKANAKIEEEKSQKTATKKNRRSKPKSKAKSRKANKPKT